MGRERKWSLRIKPGGLKHTQTYISFFSWHVDITWHDSWHVTHDTWQWQSPHPPTFFYLFGIGATMRTHWEIHYFPYAAFLFWRHIWKYNYSRTKHLQVILCKFIYKNTLLFETNFAKKFCIYKKKYILSFSV